MNLAHFQLQWKDSNPCLHERESVVVTQSNQSLIFTFFQNQMFRLNTEGQLTSGEWCANADASGAVTVQWCAMGTTDGPWEFKPDLKQVGFTQEMQMLNLVFSYNNKANMHIEDLYVCDI